jgi:ATP-binding cassette subfamily F protein 3
MLSIQNLTYRLGERLLFDEASAQLPDGARIGFVGRNGTGKTTLFRLIAGEISAEGGEIGLPRRARMGRVEQEAPGGPTRLIDFVLEADVERASLLREAETATEATRIADIQTRLADIDAHSAPARAARILSGLGFDEAAQNRALSEFSGGWRMRVALAAILFLQPDLLLLDEPTNYLDLEGALWLVDHLKTYPATVVVISHDRDLLDAVCDHILHLDRAKLTVYRGDYSSFERQRAEAQALVAKAARKQEERRRHLQEFVDRFRAKATKARQAQSRLKMLQRMETIEVAVDQDVLPIRLPSPEKTLSPPIVALERVSVGYGDHVVLRGINVSISDDDRIGLLGSNGNGKSTLARLLGGRLDAMAGEVVRAPKLETGFFAQHQVDDLDETDTPCRAVARLMADAPESKVRARAAQIGFPGVKADTPVAQLSGGEKARLLLGLSTFHGPHLIILDEPTNHLDIDSRAALIEAINDYRGAAILISHDRYLLEACADRLWLVADGGVREFDGDLDDYTKLVLEKSRGEPARQTAAKTGTAPAPKAPRRREQEKKLQTVEQRIEKLNDLLTRVDMMLADGETYQRDPRKAGELAARRVELAAAVAAAEDEWLELSGAIES